MAAFDLARPLASIIDCLLVRDVRYPLDVPPLVIVFVVPVGPFKHAAAAAPVGAVVCVLSWPPLMVVVVACSVRFAVLSAVVVGGAFDVSDFSTERVNEPSSEGRWEGGGERSG